jgi:hypothetical protein
MYFDNRIASVEGYTITLCVFVYIPKIKRDLCTESLMITYILFRRNNLLTLILLKRSTKTFHVIVV